ncbi:MAG: hypothetical protein NTY65_03550 [Planctomycetota bacterium]|nr:hypothetical protein [Planctomycetota bacterium]
MTCDLKMSLAVAAETKLRPLTATVRKLTEQLAHLRQRLETERGNVGNREADLESLKAAGGEYLTQNDFASFRVRLKRLTADLAASKEAVVLFETDLIPRTEKGLQEAREKLAQTFTTTCADARVACEARMTDLLSAVVAEHDAFLAAILDLAATYGTAYHGKPPVAYSSRLGEVKHTMTGRWWMTFTKCPPAVAAAAATTPAVVVFACPASVESTATPSLGESATSDAPRAVALAPERTDDGPAPLAAAAARARVLRRCAVATETPPDPAENPPETPPVDLALDTPAPDADEDEAPPDLDEAAAAEAEAEAPPVDGEKENPKIVPESS